MEPVRDASLPDLVSSPRWFPQLVDPVYDRVLLVEKTEAEYREASFLDERSLQAAANRRVVDWPVLDESFGSAARRDAQYIFHIGHVGSTLISRLLGELDGVFALREPMMVRTFAELLEQRGSGETPWNPQTIPGRIDLMTALFSRTFRPDQRTMVKTTSFTSEIAAEIVPAGSQALLLYVNPQRYIETILAGENSRQSHALTAADRLKRLHRSIGDNRWKLWEMREGEKVGMAWATEMVSLARAAETLPSASVIWMDFDAFLAAPAHRLTEMAAFFGHRMDEREAHRLAAHSLMKRYSKALEYEYSRELREQVLTEAREKHEGAIGEGLRWLSSAGREFPTIARCIELGGGS